MSNQAQVLYVIPARKFTDAAGNALPGACPRAAENEAWDIADKTRRNAAYAAKLAADDAEVARLALELTEDQLSFEVSRRAFGSFTTTADGSPERQAIYRRALAAKREAAQRHAELTALARHVCFTSQFNPSDDTWAAIKVYRDGNPIVLDDGFATEEEADACAELARENELADARQKPARVVAATSIVGGELVVCDGDANGPVIGRFPRTEDGHRAATAMAEAE